MKLRDLKLYSDEELALCCWAGFLGNGADRKNRLGSRYAAVQSIVDKQYKSQIIEPSKKYDKEAVKKAVKSLYDDAAVELVSLIEKEFK